MYPEGQEVFAMGQPRSIRRALWAAMLLAVALLLCLASPAVHAQAGPSGLQIKNELERTDRVLERAAQEANEVRNAYTQDRLRKARDTQRRAWSEYRTGTQASMRSALALSKNARSLALQAIEAAGIEKRARESVRAMIEQAQTRASEVQALLASMRNLPAQKLLEQAIEQLGRARTAFQEGKPQAARLAALSQSLIERAAKLAAGQAGATGAAQMSIERARALLAEAEARMAQEQPPASAQTLLSEAREMLVQAEQAGKEGRPGLALRLAASARERGLRILSLMKELPSADALLLNIEDLEESYAELAPRIEAQANAEAQAWIEQGRALLAKARDALRAGRAEETLASLVAAQSLLREAAERSGIE